MFCKSSGNVFKGYLDQIQNVFFIQLIKFATHMSMKYLYQSQLIEERKKKKFNATSNTFHILMQQNSQFHTIDPSIHIWNGRKLKAMFLL